MALCTLRPQRSRSVCAVDRRPWLTVVAVAAFAGMGGLASSCKSVGSTSGVKDVAAAARVVEVCPGININIDGTAPAANLLQACIDATNPGATLAIPWGIYLIESQIILNRPITLTTAGSEGKASCFDTVNPATVGQRLNDVPCASFIADPALWTNGGMIVLSGSNVVVDHIFLNGNRAARITPDRTAACQGGGSLPRGGGTNASANDCSDCAFTNGGSAFAVCGSGFAWGGGTSDNNAHIAYNMFLGNGDKNLVSDGLTLGIPRGANIEHNYFEDNSDVNLILFGGPNTSVHENYIYNKGSQTSFAGIMLDNMDIGTGDLGNFVGANIYSNWINCSFATPATYYGCDIGIMVGPYAWYTVDGSNKPLPRIYGGTISKNYVYHAKQGLLMAGAGTTTNPTNVDGTNVVQASAPGKGVGFNASLHAIAPGYGCDAGGTHVTSDFNADPGTVWDLAATQPAWTFNRWQSCY